MSKPLHIRTARRPYLELLESRTLLTGNLVYNGDFELGNKGFLTDYTYSPGDIRREGTYDVSTDPRRSHYLAASYGDHTSGAGLMMVVNGATKPDQVVWSQTVPVGRYASHTFSMWVSAWNEPARAAQLEVLFNDQPVGLFTAPSKTGVWQQFTSTWSSGDSKSLAITVIDRNTAWGGNDFALDDLSLTTGNLIYNGDFELGNTGFASDYTYLPGNIAPPQTYDVVLDPRLSHSGAESYRDHTSGAGRMLAVNGALSGAPDAWSQTVKVSPGTTYLFSVWVSNWAGGGTSPARLDFLFNSSSVGTFTAPSAPRVWQRFTVLWNAGTVNEATIRVVDRNTDFIGNDFALDDISLSPAFVVNSVADPGTGTCDAAECTLREAIQAANARAGTDTIAFNLPGSGVRTIRPASPLPDLTDAVCLDATTQPGFAGTPLVELDGSNAGPNASGLRILAGDSVVRGLVINRFLLNGIELLLRGGNVLEGNYIGTDAAGASAQANRGGGILISRSNNNLLGGGTPAARNLISGNDNGIFITFAADNRIQGNWIGTTANGMAALGNGNMGINLNLEAHRTLIGTDGDGVRDAGEMNVVAASRFSGIALRGAHNSIVAGNRIGTNAAGTAPLPNQTHGVYFDGGSRFNVIGTNGDGLGDAAERNLISGNRLNGVILTGSSTRYNVIAGNFVGTDVTGTQRLANGEDGVQLEGSTQENLIGTNGDGVSDALERNVISGNIHAGVSLDTAHFNTIAGNYIGTNAAGTAAVPNDPQGIWVGFGSQGNVFGTNGDGMGDLAERNVISGNNGSGIYLPSDGTRFNVIAGNYIGTDVTGTLAVPNRGHGISAWGSTDNLIGTNGDGVSDALERNVIAGNTQNGIYLFSATTRGYRIAGNFIGTSASGAQALPNGGNGVLLDGAPENLVGTDGNGIHDAAERNVVSGNGAAGIVLSGATARFNVVAGNYVGTSVTGMQGLGNRLDGIEITGGAQDNRIGTDGDGLADTDERNVSAANGNYGVALRAGANGNRIAGNFLGTNAQGTAGLGQGNDGVLLHNAWGNVIGTDGDGVGDAAERNLISGNNHHGVFLNGPNSYWNVVAGNLIGTDITGTRAARNGADGIVFADGASENRVGTNADGVSDALERNVISGNAGQGILLRDSTTRFNWIAGNFIGTDVTGTQALGNNWAGIWVQGGAQYNLIGGVVPGSGNVIAHNTGFGVRVVDGPATAILGNSIQSNGALGIANGVLTYPELTSAVNTADSITITGTLLALAKTTYRLEFFANRVCDPSGFGEGERYLGFIDVTTDADGNAAFEVTFAVQVPAGYFLSATATDPLGTTSEFSACRVVTEPDPGPGSGSFRLDNGIVEVLTAERLRDEFTSPERKRR